MGKDLAVRKKGGALMKWDEEMARHAKEASEAEVAPAGQMISVRGGQLTVAGQEIEGNKAELIILDNIYLNTYYEGDFDADNPQAPVCFAMARKDSDLKPHEDAGKPQCEQCLGCPQNEFGTAERGKGKACKNVRRLAVISADRVSEKSIKESDIFYFHIPVTSVKGWAFYVKALAAQAQRPPFGVVTTLGVVRHDKDQFHVTFQLKEVLDQKLARAALKRRELILDQTMFPFATNTGETRKSKKVKKERGAAKKARKF